MNHFKTIVWILTLFLLLHGCNRGTPIIPPPSPDITPPVWDDTVGVTSVIPGEGTVIVQWGTATDSESPPVEYLVYMDTDDDPWDQEPVVRSTNEPYTFDGLWTSIDYSFGVRCRDSVEIPNVDDNHVVMTSETAPRGWALSWGGIEDGRSSYVSGRDVKLDGNGNIYVCGSFAEDVDFDPGDETYILENYGVDYGFVSKFDSSGIFQWVTQFNLLPASIMEVDTNGNVCIAGGSVNHYITFLDTNGEITSQFHFSSGLALWSDIMIYDIEVDDDHNVYICGDFNSLIDFDLTEGEYVVDGWHDAWMGKYDWSGNLLGILTWGGSGSDESRALTLTDTGDVICGGGFEETVDFDPGPGIELATSSGYYDSFLVSFGPDGDFNWLQTWGGPHIDHVMEQSSDGLGNLYLLGYFGDIIDLDPGPGEVLTGMEGGNNRYICKYSENGQYIWGFSLDDILATSIDALNGDLSVGGYFSGTKDFDPSPGSGLLSTANLDAFVAIYNSAGQLNWVISVGGERGIQCRGINYCITGDIFFTGFYSGDSDFDPGPGVDLHTVTDTDPIGYYENLVAFLCKLAPDGYW